MSENITDLDQSNFEAFIASTNATVLVDFWAPWCGPCKAIAPILEELATELPDTVKIGKVNVDNNSELASKYEVRAIPTIKIFKGGEVADTVVGLSSKEDLTNRLS
ncbi:MAG: thioredoxin [Puniceicoccaceae bacterium MED-G32]|jgi:thioredoxin 1|nr:thioredoxin [Puniceicoccaceae bacterium]PDH26356.1 MAG: thioredoxin [Puniceicoccaceae bacterium MED-G32]RPG15948.1 MAG: thioredoxin [Opitutales bacterium TMED207]|tara:strand:+ start:19796 stop:20113 length:318 start_codon:yes stop_codon:yes gene_type:complete